MRAYELKLQIDKSDWGSSFVISFLRVTMMHGYPYGQIHGLGGHGFGFFHHPASVLGNGIDRPTGGTLQSKVNPCI